QPRRAGRGKPAQETAGGGLGAVGTAQAELDCRLRAARQHRCPAARSHPDHLVDLTGTAQRFRCVHGELGLPARPPADSAPRVEQFQIAESARLNIASLATVEVLTTGSSRTLVCLHVLSWRVAG